MKIGVAGAGAVGSYFGSMLEKAGHPVTFLARGAHLTAMQKHGLIIAGDTANVHSKKVFTADIEDLAASEVVLFCVKSNDTARMAEQLLPILQDDALILTMQNGVDNEETLEATFGKKRVLSAATYIQAFVEAPGKVHQRGRVKLLIGELDSTISSACERVIETFQTAGIDAVHSGQILKRKWDKLLWNVTFNPLSAASGARIGQILDDPRLRKTAVTISSEAIDVAIAAGIAVDPEPTVEKIFSNAEYARAHQTSMLQDRLEGKRMEVESMCGFIVRRADELGLEVPALQSIYSTLTFMNQQIGTS
ncbi:ketopantoate reductase family protein [Halobacillus naozhouensis]|uniref:2-dehydropantoate 2-reductase n=1 Tax=Halobacillus naozhouensis TaxID=554880 RepID=A0ABY8IZP9_9BACI|nr:2-dehydropantoate 2-reductase [Halobacillus naozhouensis]WFT73985.1 2-dehydropantoate 2-reductase [Halobacillus naozhouensis]